MEGSGVGKAAENARNLQLRAQEVQSKAHRAEVTSILQKHPMAAGDVVQFLHNKGMYSEGPASSGPKSKWQSGLETREARKRAARAEASLAASVNAEKIPTKYWTVGSLSVRLLETRCLQLVDPMVFSNGNLTNIKKSWAKDTIHAELVRLVEFLTGIPASFKLTEKYRKWQNFEDLLTKMYGERRWRLTGKALPVNFCAAGVFEIRAANEKDFTLTLRTGMNSLISMQFSFPVMQQQANATLVFIEENWSEASAYLQNEAGSLEGLCCLDMLQSRMQHGQHREEVGFTAQKALCNDASAGMSAKQLCGPPETSMPTWMQVATHFGKRSLELDGESDGRSAHAASSNASPSSSKYSRKASTLSQDSGLEAGSSPSKDGDEAGKAAMAVQEEDGKDGQNVDDVNDEPPSPAS